MNPTEAADSERTVGATCSRSLIDGSCGLSLPIGENGTRQMTGCGQLSVSVSLVPPVVCSACPVRCQHSGPGGSCDQGATVQGCTDGPGRKAHRCDLLRDEFVCSLQGVGTMTARGGRRGRGPTRPTLPDSIPQMVSRHHSRRRQLHLHSRVQAVCAVTTPTLCWT